MGALGLGLGLGLSGGASDVSAAALLLASETDGLATDFTDQSTVIRDTATPANAYASSGRVLGGALVGPGGKLTYASPSPKLCLQSNGYYAYAAQNLITYSELLGATGSLGWTISRATVTAGYSDPWGGTTAVLLKEDNTALNTHRTLTNFTALAGASYVASFAAKTAGRSVVYYRADLAATVKYAYFDLSSGTCTADAGLTPTITPLGNGWYQCSLTYGDATASSNPLLGLANAANIAGTAYDGDGTSGVYIARGHLRSALALTDYIKTTSSVVHGLPHEWDASGNALGLRCEESRTNVCLYNRDLTNAAWTKTNCTAAKDQTGIDGVASSASKLTATSGNATCLQAITLSSSARWHSTFIKRITGTGTIEMTMDNGSTWTAVTVTSGWTKVGIPTQTLANPTVGFRIVTSGDAIAVDCVQNENSGTNASSPIITYGSTVTRATDQLSLATSLFPYTANGAMTLFVEVASLTAGVDAYMMGLGANKIALRRTSINQAQLYLRIGGTNDISFGSTYTTAFRIAGRAATGDNALAANGSLLGSNAATYTHSLSTLWIGSLDSGIGCHGGHLKRLMWLPRGMTNAELQALTA